MLPVQEESWTSPAVVVKQRNFFTSHRSLSTYQSQRHQNWKSFVTPNSTGVDTTHFMEDGRLSGRVQASVLMLPQTMKQIPEPRSSDAGHKFEGAGLWQGHYFFAKTVAES